MADKTLTSANSTFMLSVPGLFPVPVTIQGYAVENMFDMDAVDRAEARMGADGKLSAGYTPKPRVQHIHIQPDSPSVDVFMAWDAYEANRRDVVKANAVIMVPATGKVITMTKGFMTSMKPMADHKKVQEPLDFTITWEKVTTAST